jgi:hypothetical protein
MTWASRGLQGRFLQVLLDEAERPNGYTNTSNGSNLTFYKLGSFIARILAGNTSIIGREQPYMMGGYFSTLNAGARRVADEIEYVSDKFVLSWHVRIYC